MQSAKFFVLAKQPKIAVDGSRRESLYESRYEPHYEYRNMNVLFPTLANSLQLSWFETFLPFKRFICS